MYRKANNNDRAGIDCLLRTVEFGKGVFFGSQIVWFY